MMMSSRLSSILSCLVLSCSILVIPTVQAASSSLSSSSLSTYIVHMDKSMMPLVFNSHTHWYSSILDSLNTANAAGHHHQPPRLIYSYDHALRGFCALLSPRELKRLREVPGFVWAYPDKSIKLHTTHTPEYLGLNHESGLWPASDYGQDVIVGVVDSGIWPESPSFHDTGMTPIPSRWKGKCEFSKDFNSSMCNRKLIGARCFVSGLIAANRDDAKRIIKSPRDKLGHGTHTSSTIAGNYVQGASYFGYATGIARGVAPKARLAMYKVAGREGLASDFLAAMDQAIVDGVDVISISMGFDAEHLYENPIAIASFGAIENGIVVSCSAGNEGRFGVVDNGIPWTLTVAAGTIDRSFSGTLSLGNGLTIKGWTLFPERAVVRDLPLIYDKNISTCNYQLSPSFSDSRIIICDDIGHMDIQLISMAESGVGAAVLISDDPELLETDYILWPAVVISSKDASAVIHYATTSKEARATLTFQETILGAKPAPAVALYSSRGPSPYTPTILKPDLMAPGTLVLASCVPYALAARIGTSLLVSSDYVLYSGTSMACPHVSGVVALLRGAHPYWNEASIRSAIITTANPYDNTQNPIRDNRSSDTAASPLAMGAGHIDPNRALDPGLIYDATPQDYVNLLCAMNFTKTQILTITKSSSYTCPTTPQDLNYPSFILFHSRKHACVAKEFHRMVTNVGNGRAMYKASVVAPEGSMVIVSPMRLVFKKTNERRSYNITIRHCGVPKISSGSLTWVEEHGEHRVRSPIVVSPPLDEFSV